MRPLGASESPQSVVRTLRVAPKDPSRNGEAGSSLVGTKTMRTATRGASGLSIHRRSEPMAKRNRSTLQKHYKEQARQQKQQAKAARRLQAKQRRADAASGSG